ncbi:hypothetical protein RRG08_000095 [Elysia crispata]|uniref:Uncharacterized protein n=1 Tax=Elysia crispata TaxID=231223 RepID=A0AAE1DRH7_9GAST|nr:hypothetical protein RRG08_000095 [Elysia crispata]
MLPKYQMLQGSYIVATKLELSTSLHQLHSSLGPRYPRRESRTPTDHEERAGEVHAAKRGRKKHSMEKQDQMIQMADGHRNVEHQPPATSPTDHPLSHLTPQVFEVRFG